MVLKYLEIYRSEFEYDNSLMLFVAPDSFQPPIPLLSI